VKKRNIGLREGARRGRRGQKPGKSYREFFLLAINEEGTEATEAKGVQRLLSLGSARDHKGLYFKRGGNSLNILLLRQWWRMK